MLNNNNFQIIKQFSFPDHHNFSNSEINSIIEFAKKNNSEIITTEKDFLRLDKVFQQKIKCLKVKIKMYNYDAFLKFLKK